MGWLALLDALGEDRRLVIHAGPIPGTAEVRVVDRWRDGYRCSQIVTHELIGSAAVDVMEHVITDCNRRVVEAHYQEGALDV